jgi:hypothetical protein
MSDDLFFGNDDTTLAVISLAASLAPLDGIDETAQIAETAALKITWDKSAGEWVTDLGTVDNLNVSQFAARRIWAVWSNVVGQPEAMGWGDGPENSEKGYAVVMDTEEFGVVTGQFFGITSRVISSAAKKYTRDGSISFDGKIPVKTKFGIFYNPKIG